MNFDRLFALARALHFFDLEVRFSLANKPDSDDYKWKARLIHAHGSADDYGPTPAAAVFALETHLTRLVETKHAEAMAQARHFAKALELPTEEQPK